MLISRGDTSIPVFAQARTHLSAADAFRGVVPVDLTRVFRRWGPFPGVRWVTNQSGPWDAVGRSRNPVLTDGSSVTEELVEYAVPTSFAYELTGFGNTLRHLVVGVRGEWTFSPDGDGTLVRWTYEFKPQSGRSLVLRALVAPLWAAYLRRALARTLMVVEDACGTDA